MSPITVQQKPHAHASLSTLAAIFSLSILTRGPTTLPMICHAILGAGSHSTANPGIRSTAGASVRPAGRLDMSAMEESVERYFQAGLAPSTRKTYGTAMERFHAFCIKYDIYDPFLMSEHLMCCFAAHLADEGLAPQTGKGYLVGHDHY